MTLEDSWHAWLTGVKLAAESALAALDDGKPTPVPPEPEPPIVTRQPIYVWMSDLDLAHLDNGELDSLESRSIAGYVVMTQALVGHPDIEQFIARLTARGVPFHVGVHGLQWSSEQTAEFFESIPALEALDLEPYGKPQDWWWNNSLDGTVIGENSMRPIVYPSSSASWPGSYNDLALTANGQPDTYVGCKFPAFMDDMIDAGAQPHHVDATFHNGPQVPGMTWETGIRESVRAVHQRFPSATGSAMLWPDNTERAAGPFDPQSMAEAFEAATRVSTGPVVLYQHTLARGPVGYPWAETLDAIHAAVT